MEYSLAALAGSKLRELGFEQKRDNRWNSESKNVMGSTLITFMDKYYEYDGDKVINDKGLTIGGYESAWLADLAGAFLLENTQEAFEQTNYHGLYRDDGFAVFKGE